MSHPTIGISQKKKFKPDSSLFFFLVRGLGWPSWSVAFVGFNTILNTFSHPTPTLPNLVHRKHRSTWTWCCIVFVMLNPGEKRLLFFTRASNKVGTVGEARAAVEMGASVVVAQGREAGGHGLRYDHRTRSVGIVSSVQFAGSDVLNSECPVFWE